MSNSITNLVLVVLSLSITTARSAISTTANIELISSSLLQECDGYCSGLLHEGNYINQLTVTGKKVARIISCSTDLDIKNEVYQTKILNDTSLVTLQRHGSAQLRWESKMPIFGQCIRMIDMDNIVLNEVIL